MNGINYYISKQTRTLSVWCAYISGTISIFGILFILIFYSFYLGTGKAYGFGVMNDIAVILQYIFMLPLFFVFHKILGSSNQKTSFIGFSFGLIGALSVIFLQLMLVAGFIPFSKQIGMVTIAFLVTLTWFVINKTLDKGNILLPRSMFLNIMAGILFGYPIWAFKVAIKLKAGKELYEVEARRKQ